MEVSAAHYGATAALFLGLAAFFATNHLGVGLLVFAGVIMTLAAIGKAIAASHTK